MTKKEKKAFLEAQLPLKEGRPVAFRPPGKRGKLEAGATEFIQGRVTRCLGGDKNKSVHSVTVSLRMNCGMQRLIHSNSAGMRFRI